MNVQPEKTPVFSDNMRLLETTASFLTPTSNNVKPKNTAQELHKNGLRPALPDSVGAFSCILISAKKTAKSYPSGNPNQTAEGGDFNYSLMLAFRAQRHIPQETFFAERLSRCCQRCSRNRRCLQIKFNTLRSSTKAECCVFLFIEKFSKLSPR